MGRVLEPTQNFHLHLHRDFGEEPEDRQKHRVGHRLKLPFKFCPMETPVALGIDSLSREVALKSERVSFRPCNPTDDQTWAVSVRLFETHAASRVFLLTKKGPTLSGY
jgi:hypothetical protein